MTTITYELGSDNRTEAKVRNDPQTWSTKTTFVYEAATGRLSTRTDEVIDPVNGTATFPRTFGYNTLDQLITLTYPSGRKVGYVVTVQGGCTSPHHRRTVW